MPDLDPTDYPNTVVKQVRIQYLVESDEIQVTARAGWYDGPVLTLNNYQGTYVPGTGATSTWSDILTAVEADYATAHP